jgi:hypothetical protein
MILFLDNYDSLTLISFSVAQTVVGATSARNERNS